MAAEHYQTIDCMPGGHPFKAFRLDGVFRQTPHSHSYLQLWYVLQGACVHQLADYEYEYTHGGLLIIPPGVKHAVTVSDPNTRLICCEFSERFINEALSGTDPRSVFDFLYLEPFFLSENLLDKVFVVTHEDVFTVERLLAEILEEFEQNTRYAALFLKANLLKLLAIIARGYDQSASGEKSALLARYHDSIDEAIRYIEAHLEEKLYLEEVCRASLLSHSMFSILFKQATGKTFGEYVGDRRVSKACAMLTETSRTMLDIALACGFQDATYFCRVFKRKTGMSPSQYRRGTSSKQSSEKCKKSLKSYATLEAEKRDAQ